MKYKDHEINQTCANTYQCYAWCTDHWRAVGDEHQSVAAAKRWINEEEAEA